MKKLIFLSSLILLFTFIANFLFGQSQIDSTTTQFRIVLNRNILNVNNSYNKTSQFAQLTRNFDIRQSFPGSKNDLLLRTYTLSGAISSVDSLKKSIQTLFGNEIDLIEDIPNSELVNIKQKTGVSPYNPSDYFWGTNELWHLNKIEANKAWDITKGNSNTKIAVLDTWFDLSHPDLAGKFIVNYDPYSNTVYSGCGSHPHGTTVASFIAAKTDGGGGLAGVGFNCSLIGYQAWAGAYLERAHHASLVMHADVITSSAGGWSCSVSPSQGIIESAAVKEILDNGTAIVMPAGNGLDDGASCGGTNNYSAFYPLSPNYDERVIIVTSTGEDDKHYCYNTNSAIAAVGEITHAHFSQVDVCAPGYFIHGALCSIGNTNPYYWACRGTSFSTPIVAGLAGLLKSINPCFSSSDVQELIKSTTDQVVDANSYSGLIGTGRINAFKAVQKAITFKAKFIQNQSYSSNSTQKAHTIILGQNVTGTLPTGNVTVNNTGVLSLYARNYIEINNGFEAVSGSEFTLNCDTNLIPCE